MVHWEVLPLPGLYIGDYGEQYGHRRKEVLIFEMQPPTQTHMHVCLCECVLTKALSGTPL